MGQTLVALFENYKLTAGRVTSEELGEPLVNLYGDSRLAHHLRRLGSMPSMPRMADVRREQDSKERISLFDGKLLPSVRPDTISSLWLNKGFICMRKRISFRSSS